VSELRPLPERVYVLGAWYAVVTDCDYVEDHLDDDTMGEAWHRTRNVSLRAQWQVLVHEIIEIAKKQLSLGIEHDDIDRLDSALTGALDGMGLLGRARDGEKG
jgi:hypothetical protein